MVSHIHTIDSRRIIAKRVLLREADENKKCDLACADAVLVEMTTKIKACKGLRRFGDR
jgi:hypothetical protein